MSFASADAFHPRPFGREEEEEEEEDEDYERPYPYHRQKDLPLPPSQQNADSHQVPTLPTTTPRPSISSLRSVPEYYSYSNSRSKPRSSTDSNRSFISTYSYSLPRRMRQASDGAFTPAHRSKTSESSIETSESEILLTPQTEQNAFLTFRAKEVLGLSDRSSRSVNGDGENWI